ncbi:MAG: tRNA (guanosine(46)-N7)-methyltransferase TrmB [Myxococcota bacterium]
MAPPGRPTPQRPSSAAARPDGPRFEDRRPADYRHPEANPYVTSHREFGPELLTAEQAFAVGRDWASLFGREAPLHVEIGSGNGFFLAGLARQNPDVNVLGIEIRYKRTVLCGRKIREAGVTHARIARYHAAFLDDLFEPGAIAVLWVHHPDPWPKERHEKNRLVSRWFLEDVARLLQPGGFLRLKSDFEPNVARAAHLIDHGPEGEPLPRLPLTVTGRSNDVNAGPAPWADDIETNYQRKFKRKGEPVYAIELQRD